MSGDWFGKSWIVATAMLQGAGLGYLIGWLQGLGAQHVVWGMLLGMLAGVVIENRRPHRRDRSGK